MRGKRKDSLLAARVSRGLHTIQLRSRKWRQCVSRHAWWTTKDIAVVHRLRFYLRRLSWLW